MKSVLVTGVAGFIGSHLAMHHLVKGDRVVGVDNFCSSDEHSDHLKELRSFETFTFVQADVCDDWHGWNGYLRPRLDLVYNFACPASPPAYQAMPVQTMMTCTVGVANVLDLAKETGAVVVHASTSEVYGDPTVTPQAEGYRGNVNPYGPRACYDEGKRAAEALCFDFRNKHGVDARLVRIFNSFGPNMHADDGRVVTNFISQALRREKLTVYGDGTQTRSFCYVDDLVRGIVAMGAVPHNPGTPVNLGNPTEFTVMELAQHVVYQVRACSLGHPHDLDVGSFIERRPLPTDDPTQRRPDVALARRLLGWEPEVSLAQGLRKTITYLRKELART